MPLFPPASSAGSPSLLNSKSYAPAGAVTLNVASVTLVPLDVVNLTVPFTTAASGLGSTQVLVRVTASSAQAANLLIGIVNHTGGAQMGPAVTADGNGFGNAGCYAFLITGLTPNTAYGIDLAAAGAAAGSTPVFVARNASAASQNAGPITIEVWAA